LQKIDGKLLAQKVFPYLDLNVVVTPRDGPRHSVNVEGLALRTVDSGAKCAPDETAVSGGFSGYTMGGGSEIGNFLKNENPNVPVDWRFTMTFRDDGAVKPIANCLKVELDLKQPEQQPPGGPPLQPPPNLR
jgi:hypothetical protein